VEDADGRVLLGQRVNRPVKGVWFVPGGRIFKNETLDDAFLRISETELGLALKRDDAAFLGVFEHFYNESVFGSIPKHPDTHYVVLAYRLMPSIDLFSLPRLQHQCFCWWRKDEILTDAAVHENCRAYLPALQ
jgi:colanic acid biosynthesis protein WcaH